MGLKPSEDEKMNQTKKLAKAKWKFDPMYYYTAIINEVED